MSPASESHLPPIPGLDASSGVLSLELPEFAVDTLLETLIPADMSDPEAASPSRPDASPEPPDTTIRIELSPEQSQVIEALPHLVKAEQQSVQMLTFDVKEHQDQRRIVLQFSLHCDNVPEMISLKDLCHQLKVGRRSVLRLIRQGSLRCYRIGKRYRFAASDVKHYLEQISSH